MRLVLLPGLNGSSNLFAPLLDALRDVDCQPLALPDQGPQDYASLTDRLLAELGHAPFVLLGESFSGPLAFRLALRKPEGLRAVIFAATFLTRPSPFLALFRHMPMPPALVTHAPILRALCLGRDVEDAVLRRVQEEIRGLDQALLRARLGSLAGLRAVQGRLAVPALQLWPQQDRLVAARAGGSLAAHCDDLRQVRLDGPHFILQARPHACAQAIRTFLADIAQQQG